MRMRRMRMRVVGWWVIATMKKIEIVIVEERMRRRR